MATDPQPCPLCHEDAEDACYCIVCERWMCCLCFGNPVFEVCRACRRKEAAELRERRKMWPKN